MTKVETIKHEIESLTDAERSELHNWLLRQEWTDDDWDRQMRVDAKSGKLDGLISKARAEIRQGRTQELP